MLLGCSVGGAGPAINSLQESRPCSDERLSSCGDFLVHLLPVARAAAAFSAPPLPIAKSTGVRPALFLASSFAPLAASS